MPNLLPFPSAFLSHWAYAISFPVPCPTCFLPLPLFYHFGHIRLASLSIAQFLSLSPLLLLQFGHIQAAVFPYAHKTSLPRGGFLTFNSYMPKTLIFSAFFFPFRAYRRSFLAPCPTCFLSLPLFYHFGHIRLASLSHAQLVSFPSHFSITLGICD